MTLPNNWTVGFFVERLLRLFVCFVSFSSKIRVHPRGSSVVRLLGQTLLAYEHRRTNLNLHERVSRQSGQGGPACPTDGGARGARGGYRGVVRPVGRSWWTERQ